MSCILIAMFSHNQRADGAERSPQVPGRVWDLMLRAHLSRAMAVME